MIVKRRIFIILLIFLSISFVNAQKKRPKIGLVLSGGGARGLAHIGTLQLIDSLQIPIDYVVGTSMGSIIGGLYALGYTGNEIEKFVRQADWTELFTDKPERIDIPYLEKKDDEKFVIELGLKKFTPIIPSAMISGQNVSLMLKSLTSSYESIVNFDNFRIPYRCVAIDLVTGNEVVLSRGSISKAMRSSMSIPTVFSPVEWGDSLLIDGGVLNNFPADIMKKMGADIIIGVNVGTTLKSKQELSSMISVLEQATVLTDYAKQKQNEKLCEIVVKPELGDYSSADFDTESVTNIIELGQQAAADHKHELIDFYKKYLSGYRIEHIEEASLNGKIIENISVGGVTTFPIKYVIDKLGIHPFDKLDQIKVKDGVSALLSEGSFDNVSISYIPVTDSTLQLIVKVSEKEKPTLYGIQIQGNEELSFEFIYNLLDQNPNLPFDKEHLHDQIRRMYSLGYFESIDYSIEPVRENLVQLNVTVKEKSMRKLRVGYRYDDEYKLVGILGLKATNTPFTGLRAEMELQFAGLFKFDYELTYPSRNLNLPLFPYFRTSYKDIPVSIYDSNNGERIAEYADKSWTIAAGLMLNLGDIGAAKFEYNHEYMNIAPNFTGMDSTYFPSWKEKLRVFRASIDIDLLDDPIIPRKGIRLHAFYDYSPLDIKSEVNYAQTYFNASFYKTFSKRHTFRINGSYTGYLNHLPVYKFITSGGPNSFVGLEINQLATDMHAYLRLDYRYEFKRDIFFKVIANVGTFTLNDITFGQSYEGHLYGAGIGVKFLSIIGPFEFIVSKGPKSILHWDDFETNFYFTAGFNF